MTTTELAQLLADLGRQGFVNFEFPVNCDGPAVLGFVHDWGGVADVVIVRNENDACAYRTATGPGVDLFAPRMVSSWYAAPAVWTLRVVLTGITLTPPGHPDEPTQLTAPPPGYALPQEGRMDPRSRMRTR